MVLENWDSADREEAEITGIGFVETSLMFVMQDGFSRWEHYLMEIEGTQRAGSMAGYRNVSKKA